MIFTFGERELAETVALYFLTWERDKVARVLRCYNVFIFIFYFLNIVLMWKIVVPTKASVFYIYIYRLYSSKEIIRNLQHACFK